MKSITKYMLPLLCAATLLAGGCSEWTQTESLPLDRPAQDDPALYKQYLEALRVYKQREHKVTFYCMPGSSLTPSKRADHITAAPDSVDFICIKNPVGLHPSLVAQMDKVREKSTRFLYTIDFAKIEADWRVILDKEAEDALENPSQGEPEEPTMTPEERFLDYCKTQVAQQVAIEKQYNYDGIEFAYSGLSMDGMTQEQLDAYTKRQDAFLGAALAWKQANPTKDLFFQGSPQDLVDKSLLNHCSYIILDTFTATGPERMTYSVQMASVEGVPTDRFVVGVQSISATDAAATEGYFFSLESDGVTKMRSIKGAARWNVIPQGHYTKAGIMILNAQNDYYHPKQVFATIREAISIMNPTPNN